MPGKKKQEAEFQYYEMPHGEFLLAISGKSRPWGYEGERQSKKQHFHNLLEIGYCITGDGKISFGDKTVDYGQGMLTVIPQNFPHSVDSGIHTISHWEYLLFNPGDLLQEFYSENPMFAKKILEYVNRKEQYYAISENNQLTILVRLILEECKEKGSFSGEYIRGLILAMLMMIARGNQKLADAPEDYQPGGGMIQISAALDYIGKNYMENIKTKTLAAACNLSETHFRRLFAESMNMTPLEYINLVRIQQACDLMRKTRYSMEEVAARVGYPAISTFNRNFRKIMGTSPYQYKKGI